MLSHFLGCWHMQRAVKHQSQKGERCLWAAGCDWQTGMTSSMLCMSKYGVTKLKNNRILGDISEQGFCTSIVHQWDVNNVNCSHMATGSVNTGFRSIIFLFIWNQPNKKCFLAEDKSVDPWRPGVNPMIEMQEMRVILYVPLDVSVISVFQDTKEWCSGQRLD